MQLGVLNLTLTVDLTLTLTKSLNMGYTCRPYHEPGNKPSEYRAQLPSATLLHAAQMWHLLLVEQILPLIDCI